MTIKYSIKNQEAEHLKSRAVAVKDAPYPLTPALSLRERENRSQRVRKAST